MSSAYSIDEIIHDVDLNIFTFLKGERDIENPIHKTFKPLEHKTVEKAVKLIANHLKKYII